MKARREKQCKELKLYKDMTQIKFNASSSWKKNEKKTNTTGRHGERKRLFNTSFSTSESHDWRFELNWSELFFPLHPSVCRDHETAHWSQQSRSAASVTEWKALNLLFLQLEVFHTRRREASRIEADCPHFIPRIIRRKAECKNTLPCLSAGKTRRIRNAIKMCYLPAYVIKHLSNKFQPATPARVTIKVWLLVWHKEFKIQSFVMKWLTNVRIEIS